MIGLIQRVTQASVTVANQPVAAIGSGLLVLVGIEKEDQWQNAQKLANKLLNYRVFADAQGKMNCSVREAGGEILLVSQFTLAANTGKGNRPGFDPAMPPDQAAPFFARFCDYMAGEYPQVKTGEFGANMQVALINNGPVTFWLRG